MQAISKVTSKYQATIPLEVRSLLGLKQGDALLFEEINGEVKIRVAKPMDIAYLAGLTSTLQEWQSPADDEAYRAL
jgi:AbrB family looped-hinge helix DNA binding protein